jgi:hypothetical protein
MGGQMRGRWWTFLAAWSGANLAGREAMNAIEEVRQRYRPPQITALFVGESAPKSGDFFYLGNTNMTRYMRRALVPEAGSDLEFLDTFKARGFYLDDLVLVPINGMTGCERRAHWRRSSPGFVTRLTEYRPAAVVLLVKGMRRVVERAVRESRLAVPFYAVPFPGMSHQNDFLAEMAALIGNLPCPLMGSPACVAE